MKIIRYAIARLAYYKKQTIVYTLFSSFFAFLLLISFNLYNLQTTLHKQIQNRLTIFSSTNQEEKIPQLDSVSHFYSSVILVLVLCFALCFFFFFIHILKQNRQELMNWRLTGFSQKKLFFFVYTQMFVPIAAACLGLLLWSISFQHLYETLLQSINLTVLDIFKFPDFSVPSSVSGLTIPINQETFFQIDFTSEFLLVDTFKGIVQTLLTLTFVSLFISVLSFIYFSRRLQKGRFIQHETTK